MLFLDSILESGSELSPCIYRCRNVRILSLKNNFLKKISPEIGNKFFFFLKKVEVELYGIYFCVL